MERSANAKGRKGQMSPVFTGQKKDIQLVDPTYKQAGRTTDEYDDDRALILDSAAPKHQLQSQMSRIDETNSSISKENGNSPAFAMKRLKSLHMSHLSSSKQVQQDFSMQKKTSGGFYSKRSSEFPQTATSASQNPLPVNIKRQLTPQSFVSVTSKQYSTIKFLGDKEKFILAKKGALVDVLLELISSNDTINNRGIGNDSILSAQRCSGQVSASAFQNQTSYPLRVTGISNQQLANVSQYSQNQSRSQSNLNSILGGSNDLHSDLRKEWMGVENLISHAALNQLSYLILQKRKETKFHMYYNTESVKDKTKELIALRKQIIRYFHQTKIMEKRIQRYLLMADESGIQSAYYLLLVLSDDEISTSKRQAICSGGNSGGYLYSTGNEQKLSVSSNQSKLLLDKNQSIVSSLSKGKSRLESVTSKKVEKDLKSGWFKKNAIQIIDNIENVINDQSFTKNSVRVAILLLGNMYFISKSHVKSFARKKPNYFRLINFFEDEKDNMDEDEIGELEIVLKLFYSSAMLQEIIKREAFTIKTKETVQIEEFQDKGEGGINEFTEKRKNLIRQDSLDSLIEMVQQEPSNFDQICENSRFTDGKTSRPDMTYLLQKRKTGSEISPETSHYHRQKQSGDSGQIQNTSTYNTDYHIHGKQQLNGQNPQLLKIPQNKVVLSKAQKYSPRHVGSPPGSPNVKTTTFGLSVSGRENESHYGNQCQTVESMAKGTPVENTLLDMKESYMVQDRSFHIMLDMSHNPDLQLTQNQPHSPRPRQVLSSQSSSNYPGSPGKDHQYSSKQRRRDQSKSSLDGYRDQQIDYLHPIESSKPGGGGGTVSLTTMGASKTNHDLTKSTQFNTKLGLKQFHIIRSENELQNSQATSLSCCFGFRSGHRDKKSSKKQHKDTFNGAGEGSNSLIIKNGVPSIVQDDFQRYSQQSSINSFILCSHNQDGTICKECQNYVKQRAKTKEKLDECLIF